jgi:glycosyltransferase involved in cell wall biosynthesis
MDLEVLLLKSQRQHMRSPENRGAEWARPEPKGYGVREVSTWRMSRGEASYYTSKPFALGLGRGRSAVVLGGWESPSYVQALVGARRRGIATVGFYESTLLSQSHHDGPIAALRRAFFDRLDAVVVPGEAAEAAVLAMDAPGLRIFRGFNAVDVGSINARASAARGRLPALEAAKGHRYLYVGQLIARKNVAAALHAFVAAAEPWDSFTITGAGELQEELRMLNLPGVQFTGPIPYAQLPDLLARHDTLVLPSTGEVWGLVVNEALAAGLHVVVSNRCGVAQSVSRMAGVTVVMPTIHGLRDGMVHSRRTWRGPIGSPEILGMGPREFASTFVEAITYAMSRKVRS